MKKTKDAIKLTVQKERLGNVLNDLNCSQADIVRCLNYHNIAIDASRMSDYLNGKRLLTDEVLNGLHLQYFINPQYLKGQSEDMYDIPQTILNYALSFAKEITITENSTRKAKTNDKENDINATNQSEPQNEKYLHITMYKKYYDYLINLDLLEQNYKKGTSEYEVILSKIKELYINGDTETEEYVLLPKNSMFNIIQDALSNRKHFEELIDAEKCSGFLTSKTTKKIKLSKGNTNN